MTRYTLEIGSEEVLVVLFGIDWREAMNDKKL
jgi:hypothetical protein